MDRAGMEALRHALIAMTSLAGRQDECLLHVSDISPSSRSSCLQGFLHAEIMLLGDQQQRCAPSFERVITLVSPRTYEKSVAQ